MRYYEIELKLTSTPNNECTTETASDILTAMLADIGFESFETTDEGLKAYIQTTIYNASLLASTLDEFPLPDWNIKSDIREAEYTNWNEQWEKEGFQPIVIGNQLCVHDARHTDVPSTKYELLVSPRLAFGSGTHPTTRQLLEVILEINVKGFHVIDAGCGTGILGMLCKLCGASKVSGYDIDEWSVANSKENAEINGIDLHVWQGDATVLPKVVHQEGKANLLIANINRNILLADMPSFVEALESNSGKLLLSGFYESDVPVLLAKAQSLGLHESFRRQRDGWVVLMLSF